ncbi:MAG: DUF1775 domain-containing protein, partial [Pseudomonadota bacterium]
MNMNTLVCASAAFLITTIAAHAHATLEVPQASVNSYYKAVIRIPHGCDGQATQKVRITIPEGLIAVKPMPKAGWTLETVNGDYANTYELHGRQIENGVKEIIWTGLLEDHHYEEFIFRARVTDVLPVGETLYIPTIQECADSNQAWVEIPAEGQDAHSLDGPAPGLVIMAAQTDHGHHSHAGHDTAMQSVAVGDLKITVPLIRATPPNAPVAAGYMVIRNEGAQADRLIGGS